MNIGMTYVEVKHMSFGVQLVSGKGWVRITGFNKSTAGDIQCENHKVIGIQVGNRLCPSFFPKYLLEMQCSRCG